MESSPVLDWLVSWLGTTACSLRLAYYYNYQRETWLVFSVVPTHSYIVFTMRPKQIDSKGIIELASPVASLYVKVSNLLAF